MIKKFIFLAVFVSLTVCVFSEDISVVMVGNKVVLESDVREKMRDENKDYEAALRELVIEKLLLFQAEKERVEVQSEEVAFEVDRIKQNFSDEGAFLAGLEKEKIPYNLFLKKIEESIRVRKLIKENVSDKIRITIPEITEKMKELEEKSGKLYTFKLKWFENKSLAEEFIKQFDEEKEPEMSDEISLADNDIMPEVLNEIERLSLGEISNSVAVGNRYAVILLKNITEGNKPEVYLLYNRARGLLQNMKFAEAFNSYLRELQGKTPVFYSE